MIRRQVLPNGVRIVTEKIDYVQSASIGIWVGVGARDESDDVRGISHVIEHMLFKGTPTRTAPQISDEIDRVGGYLNAFTDKENTCYYAKVLKEHQPIAIDVLSDVFLNSLFDADELAKEKNVILEEIKRHEDQPDDLIHDVFFETMWPEHNLGKPVIGTSQTVSSFERRNLVEADRTRTNREYLGQLRGKSLPASSLALLTAMVDAYDQFIYGRAAIGEAEWKDFHQQMQEAALLLHLDDKRTPGATA